MLFPVSVGLAAARGCRRGRCSAGLHECLRGQPFASIAACHVRIVNAWYSLGPVLVLGPRRRTRRPQLPRTGRSTSLALISQFAVEDDLTRRPRMGCPLGARPRVPAAANVYGSMQSTPGSRRSGSPSPSRRILPVGVVLALPLRRASFRSFARERQVRMDHALELPEAYRGTAFLSATWSRPTTSTPACTAATCRLVCASPTASLRRRAPRSRVRRAAPRRREGPGPEVDHQQAGPARRPRSAR